MKWTPDNGFEVEVERVGNKVILRVGVIGSKTLSIGVSLDATMAGAIGHDLKQAAGSAAMERT